jgi:hypothetical protein
MNRSRLLAALTGLLLVAAPLAAADLAQLDRKILKEPTYQGRPKYCLLAFGPEAEARVWLVLDGDTLYVDRNGNGDLTEPGERVARKDDGSDGFLSFEAGDLHVGGRTHKGLRVYVRNLDALAGRDDEIKEHLARNPHARGYQIALDVENATRKGHGLGGRIEQLVSLSDARGFLAFADDAQHAPVVHFGGPLQLTLFGKHRFTVGRETDLVLGLGTPGLGAGTTAYVAYEGLVPEQAHPRAEVVYPPRRPGDKPVRELYELKHRC